MTPEEREEYELQKRLKAAKDANLDKNSGGIIGSNQRKEARKSEDIAEGRLPKPADPPKPTPAPAVDAKTKAKEEKEIAEGDADIELHQKIQEKKMKYYKKLLTQSKK